MEKSQNTRYFSRKCSSKKDTLIVFHESLVEMCRTESIIKFAVSGDTYPHMSYQKKPYHLLARIIPTIKN